MQFGNLGTRHAWRRGLVAVLLVGMLCPMARAKLSREKILDLYSQAKDYFRQATKIAHSNPGKARELFRQAAMGFETIVREGDIQNGQLYYNIGNAYFRIEDLGRAILNYRRAQQYIPNDPNLQENLAYARARRLDKIPEPESRKVLRTLFFWHYDWSLKTRSFLFMGAFGAFWAALGVRLFRRSAWLHWVMGISSILCLLMIASLAVDFYRQQTQHPGVITADKIVARKGDSTTYAKAFTQPLHAGTEFNVLEDRGDWLQVALADGRTCWLPRSAIAMVR